MSDTPHQELIDRLIESQAWALVEQHFRANPDEVRKHPSHLNASRGTRLHWLCSMGSTPGSIIGLVASLYPAALAQQEARFGDTPLHIAARNSVVSADKVRALLQQIDQLDPDIIFVRNSAGATALHSASNHNAVLEVLVELVNANNDLVRLTTRQGVHAVSALWHSYMQTIPGHLCVAQILAGDSAEERREPQHFVRFWRKCVFLATEHYRRSLSHCPANLGPQELLQYVLHGLIQCNVPVNLFKVALQLCPSYAVATDVQGDTCLHVMLVSRPYRLKEKDALSALLRAAPEVAGQPNNAGRTPLAIGILNRIPWKNGLDLVVAADQTAVAKRDPSTSLLPFQLAASTGGKVSIETTYHLLLKQPDLLCL